MKYLLKMTSLILLSALLALSLFPVSISAEEAADADDGIVYKVRHVKSGGNSASAENCHTAESEHFQMLWGDLNNSFITQEWLDINLGQFEACWDLYVGDLGMTPPSLCTRRGSDQTDHYKVNIVVWGTGLPGFGSDPNEWAAYGSIDDEGFAFMMCCRDAMTAVGASESWVVPHEFGHATQFAQGYNSWENCKYLGPWYEAIGNWYREQYLYSDYYTAGEGFRTDFSPLILRAASLTATNGRAYYEAWPIFQYLTENPDGLDGYGSDFVAKLLQNGSSSGYIYNMIEEHADAPLEDTLGYFAAHMATLDFERQDSYIAKINDVISSWQTFFWQQFYTMLEAVPGEADTYVVPTERAPQAAAYVVAPLDVNGDEIKVTLRGLSASKGAAWRACIVTVSGGEEHYSTLFGDGETMSVSADGVEEAYLTVAATPSLDTYVKFTVFESEVVVPFKQKPRYPFEAVITGASPSVREIDPDAAGAPHPNGGGLVASTAKVDDSVYVAPGAKVLGRAVVKGDVRIEDNAVVTGSARVSGSAVIGGCAVVAGSAAVSGNAYVGGSAVVTESAKVQDDARVIESAYVGGTFTVKENATAKGLALCLAGGTLSGEAVADGDFFDDSGREITSGTAMGYFPGFGGDEGAIQSYLTSLLPQNKLILGYNFAEPSDPMIAEEQNGSTYASVVGAEWSAGSRDTALGFYTFADGSQYMIIDGDPVLSRELQIAMNIRYDGGDGAILTYEGENGSMTLTPKNAGGKAELTLTVGEETLTLKSQSALPVGEWTKVTVTFADGKSALTINGETHDAADTALSPADIKASACRLGGCSFAADSIQFYRTNKNNAPMTVTATEQNKPQDTSADTTPGTDAPTEEKSGCGSAVNAVPGVVCLAVMLAGSASVCAKKRRK